MKIQKFEVIINVLSTYPTSNDAKNNTNREGTIEKGIYDVINISEDGMICLLADITTLKEVWVNPEKNCVVTKPEIVAEKFKVVTKIPGYGNVYYAKRGENSLVTLTPGMYFVFRRSEGFINLTTDKSIKKAGYWINPNDNYI